MQEQLLDDKACFDRLAEPHVVREQKVRRGLERAAERFELVRLHIRARPEGGLVAVRVRTCDGSPPHRVDKAREHFRWVEVTAVGSDREALRWRDRVADFELPHDAQARQGAALVEGLKIDDMAQLCDGVVSRGAWQSLCLDVRDRPRAPADFDDPALPQGVAGLW